MNKGTPLPIGRIGLALLLNKVDTRNSEPPDIHIKQYEMSNTQNF